MSEIFDSPEDAGRAAATALTKQFFQAIEKAIQEKKPQGFEVQSSEGPLVVMVSLLSAATYVEHPPEEAIKAVKTFNTAMKDQLIKAFSDKKDDK